MKKKLLTLLTLLICAVGSTWAEEAVLSWYMGTNGAAASSANSITGASGCAAEGFTIAITGNAKKNWSNGNGDITYNDITYKTLKNSNGAQNTITCPTGYVATNVVFYVTTNADSSGKLSEIDGTSCSDEVSSLKDYENPTVISKAIDFKNSFTFTFGTKQVCFIAVVTYQTPKPVISTQPVSAVYQLNASPEALTVDATPSGGSCTYQWYSCDDAEKTNSTLIIGEISSSYTPSTASTGTFYYFCRVTDDNGTTDSDVATITISEATLPSVSVSSSASEIYKDETVTLTATATGVPVPTIQWYSCDDTEKSNVTAIVGATSATYSPSTSVAGTFYYYAVASNSVGSVSSNVVTLTVTPLFNVTFSLGTAEGVEGVVPSAQEVMSSITIPANQTLYKEGYTLTGWSDGVNTYAAGDVVPVSSDVALIAVFAENTTELGLCSSNITWQFIRDNGAPTWAHEGDAAYIYVAQSKVGDKVIDIKMTMDPSSGKINNTSFSDWCQMNEGTKLTVPVVKGAVLKLYSMNTGTTTFEGNSGEYASNIFTYTATTTGDLEILIGSGTWFKYLSIAYPVVGCKIYDFATSVGTGVKEAETPKVSLTTQSINGSSTNVIKFESSLSSSAKHYWKITPSAGIFKAGDRIAWTGCYSHNDTKTTTISIYDDEAISTAIVTGENFANVNGGSTAAPKALTSGYFVLTNDAEALYIGRQGGTNTFLTELTVVRNQENGEISASGFNTFSSPCALNLSTISGGTAYVASSVTDGKVVLTKVADKIVAGGTGLMIAGTVGDPFTIGTTADAATFTGDNLFVGMPNGGEVEVAGSGYNYVFGWTEVANPGFYKVVSDVPTLEAGKAYLHTTAELGATPARLALSFTDDETTGIETVNNVQCSMFNGQCFDLQGRRWAAPQKGLYIVNGKKVVIK